MYEQLLNLLLVNFILKSHPVSGISDLREPPPLYWKEHWLLHTQNFTRVYLNKIDYVAIYFETPSLQNEAIVTNYYNSSWLFHFAPKVWSYMTKTYGNFGPDPYLSVIVHAGTKVDKGKNFKALIGYSLYDRNNVYDKRNVLEVISNQNLSKVWTDSPKRNISSEALDTVTNYLGNFVEKSSKDRRSSPSEYIWKSTLEPEFSAWTDIFTYDVYTKLNLTEDAERFKNEQLTKGEDKPRKYTYWLRDWCLPIYTRYGGNRALNAYFQILHDELPHSNKSFRSKINVGELVHFWSGAAEADLTDLAENAFGWDDVYNGQFFVARRQYPNVTDKYELTSGRRMNDSNLHVEIILFVSVGVLSLIAMLSTTFVIVYKRKNRNLLNEIRTLSKKEVKEFFEGDPHYADDQNETQCLIQSMPFVRDFEIERDQVILAQDKIIGDGQFGCVMHGFVRLPSNVENILPVAIKVAKPTVDVQYFKTILSEVKIMAYLGKHEHIVGLIGTCTANVKNREILIAMEFCSLGNLQDYLQKHQETFQNGSTSSEIPEIDSKLALASNKLSLKDLLEWSKSISSAMIYLTEKKVIHGDLATRNILLTAFRVAKLCDFGLSRQFLNYENYMKKSKTPVPWKWLAIESLKGKTFSMASDVWAFGVTMWEIFSLGETPYPGWTYDFYFIDRLVQGDRLQRPLHASQQQYELMLNCWNINPVERPSFQQIFKALENLTTDSSQISITIIDSNNEIESTRC